MVFPASVSECGLPSMHIVAPKSLFKRLIDDFGRFGEDVLVRTFDEVYAASNGRTACL